MVQFEQLQGTKVQAVQHTQGASAGEPVGESPSTESNLRTPEGKTKDLLFADLWFFLSNEGLLRIKETPGNFPREIFLLCLGFSSGDGGEGAEPDIEVAVGRDEEDR